MSFKDIAETTYSIVLHPQTENETIYADYNSPEHAINDANRLFTEDEKHDLNIHVVMAVRILSYKKV